MHKPWLLFATILVASSAVSAQSLDDVRQGTSGSLPPPEEHVIWKADLQFRTNPIGLLLANQLVWREHHEADGSTLYRGTYQQASLDVNISPAFVEVGPAIEFRPMNLFVYRIGYQVLIYFGTLGYALSFPSGDAPFGDDVVEPLEEAGAETSGVAHRFMVQQTSQAAFGKFVIRNQLTGYYHLFPERTFEGPYVRERIYDTLQGNYDAMVNNTAAVLYEPWSRGRDSRILVGPYHEITYAVGARLSRHRVGALFLAIPADRWGKAMYLPRFYVQSGVNVVDRNRDDEFFVQGGLGFDLRLRTATR